MTTNADGETIISGGSIVTTGDQTYTGAVTLGADVELTAKSASNELQTVTFNASIDGDSNSLTIEGNAVFGNDVNDTVTEVNELVVSGNAEFNGTVEVASLAVSGTSAINTANITTTGIQTYRGDVTLGANASLTTTNSDIKFDSKLDGSHTLSLTTGSGDITFGNTVGETNPLGAINITSANNVSFTGDVEAASLAVSGTSAINADITTSGTRPIQGSNLDGTRIL